MDSILIPLLIINLSVFIILSIRAGYWTWSFLNKIWIKDSKQAHKYGIPGESFWGSIEVLNAVYSKEKSSNIEVERLRMKSRNSGKFCFLSLIPFPFIILGFIIPRILNPQLNDSKIRERMSSSDYTVFLQALGIIILIATIMIVVTKLRKAKRDKLKQ